MIQDNEYDEKVFDIYWKDIVVECGLNKLSPSDQSSMRTIMHVGWMRGRAYQQSKGTPK